MTTKDELLEKIGSEGSFYAQLETPARLLNLINQLHALKVLSDTDLRVMHEQQAPTQGVLFDTAIAIIHLLSGEKPDEYRQASSPIDAIDRFTARFGHISPFPEDFVQTLRRIAENDHEE